jgi:hypothetical protein
METTDSDRVARLLQEVAAESTELKEVSDRLRADIDLLRKLLDEPAQIDLLRTLFVHALRH